MKWLAKLNRTVKTGDGTAAPVAETHAVSALSPRELQVFYRMLDGAKLKDIAAEIDVQASTVGGYSRQIYRKLGLNSRAQLILQYGSYRKRDCISDGPNVEPKLNNQ